MNIIKFKSDTLDSLKYFNKGYESIIYEDHGYLLKIFKTDNKAILKNKFKKLEILDKLRTNDVLPTALISVDNTIKGYLFRNENYYNLSYFDKKKDKLNYLKMIREKLDNLHENNIIFGDISTENILTNGTDIKFCDLDNSKIGKYNFDVLNTLEKNYLKYLDADEYLDNYMYNMFVISYVCKVHMPYCEDFIYKAYKKGLPHLYDTNYNGEILEAMIKLKDKEKIKRFEERKKIF